MDHASTDVDQPIVKTSKLDRWCESFLEAGWLAALVLAPCYFNVFSARVFEPDKVVLIRSLALIMGLAWLVKIVDGGRLWLRATENGESVQQEATGTQVAPALSLRSWWRTPLLAPILLLVLVYVLSSLLSVTPSISWWGSYPRLQGTFTFLSYVAIGLLTAAHLRSSTQIRRLQHAIILTSLPIALYALIQHYGLDPLPWSGPGGDEITARSAANAGNPIFLSAYLLMALFFTIERLFILFAQSSSGALEEPDAVHEAIGGNHEIPIALAGGAYLFVLLAQVMAILWSQSRGPVLALLVGLYLFGLLLLSSLRPSRYRAWMVAWLGVAVIGLILLLLLNTPFVASLTRPIPSLARLSTILDAGSQNARVRVLIWQGAAEILTPHAPLIDPSGDPDRLNSLRPLLGYGPEAMWVAFNRFYPPELASYEGYGASADRAHNAIWDALITTGILGCAAYLALFIAIFTWGLHWLGLIRNRAERMRFLLLVALSSVAYVLGTYFFDKSWRFFVIALPAGLLFGVAFYVAIAAFSRQESRAPARTEIPRLSLISMLLALLASHFLESQFGIGVAPTYTYFWVAIALLLAVGMRWAQLLPSATTASPIPSLPALPLLPAAVMTDLLIFLTLPYLYTILHPGDSNALAILWKSLVMRPFGDTQVFSPAIFALILFTWLMAATLVMAGEALRQPRTPGIGWWLRGYGLHGLVVWGGWLGYGLIHAGRLVGSAAVVPLDSQLERILGNFTLFISVVVGWMVVAATVYAWTCLVSRATPIARRPAITAAIGAILAVVLFLSVGRANLAQVYANMVVGEAERYEAQRDWLNQIAIYSRALRIQPREDHYLLLLGYALVEQAYLGEAEGTLQLQDRPTWAEVLALTSEDFAQMGKSGLLLCAEVILQRGRAINPLNIDHTANLARLYRAWADLSTDPSVREAMLEKSLAQYDIAVQLSPTMAHLWNEKGSTLQAHSDLEAAEAAYLHSLELDRFFEDSYMLLAALYDSQARYAQSVEVLEQGIAALEAHPLLHPSTQMVEYLQVERQRLSAPDQAGEDD